MQKLERKLSPEQLLLAHIKSKDMAEQLILERKKSGGWSNWLSSSVTSMVSFGWSSGKQDQQADESFKEGQDELEQYLQKVQQFTDRFQNSQSYVNKNGDGRILKEQLSISLPLLKIALVNKSMTKFSSKQFVALQFTECIYQSMRSDQNRHGQFSSILFSIRNFEIVDKLLNQQKFTKMVAKKEHALAGQSFFNNQNKQSSPFKKRRENFPASHSSLQLTKHSQESLSEIEEESCPSLNNGMTQIYEYSILKNQLEVNQTYFLVFQVQENDNQAKLDFCLTPVQIFYNPTLIHRLNSFQNQTSIGDTHGLANQDLQKFEQETRTKIQNVIAKKELQVNCIVKSLEVLVPDRLNYELSKFLIFSCGELQVKTGQNNNLLLFFREKSDKQILNRIKNCFKKLNESDFMESFFCFDKIKDTLSMMIFDFKVFYIPTVDQLENYIYNNGNQVDFEQRHSILRRTDILLEYQSITQSKFQTEKIILKIGVGFIEIRLTNKDIQQLKDFVDSCQKYHQEIHFELSQELQAINSSLKFVEFQSQNFDELNSQKDKFLFDDSLKQDEIFLFNSEQSPTKNTFSLSNTFKSIKRMDSNNSFCSAQDYKSIGDQEFEDFEPEQIDEFQDANDYFDQTILQKIEKIGSKLNQDMEEEKSKLISKQKNIQIQFCMHRLRVQILEAPNIQQEFLESLKEHLGNNSINRFDIQLKGIPFLELEIGTVDFQIFKNQTLKIVASTIKNFSLLNVEKRGEPRSIFISTHSDDSKFLNDKQEIIKTPPTPQELNKIQIIEKPRFGQTGPEDEDFVLSDQNFTDDQASWFDENFFDSIYLKVNRKKLIKVSVRHTEIEITENLIRKINQTIFIDLPTSEPYRNYVPNKKQDDNCEISKFEFEWQSFQMIIKDKKDQICLKSWGITFQKDYLGENKKYETHVKDLQIILEDTEIFMRHHCGVPRQGEPIEHIVNSQKDNLIQNDDLFEFQITKNPQLKQIDLKLKNFLLFCDFKRFCQILSLVNTFSQMLASVKDNQIFDWILKTTTKRDFEFRIAVCDSFINIPSKENKNSLYLVFEDFQAHYTKKLQSNKKQMFAKSGLFQIFIGQSFDQSQRYNFFNIDGLVLKTLDKSVDLEIESILITANENYAVLIKKLAEEHLGDLITFKLLLSKFQSIQFFQQKNTNIENIQLDEIQQIVQEDKIEFQELFENNLDKIQPILNFSEFDNLSSNLKEVSLKSISIETIKLEWLFGRTFDDHQEQFVTLNNRNYSKLILEQLDKAAEKQNKFFINDSPRQKTSKSVSQASVGDNSGASFQIQQQNDVELKILENENKNELTNLLFGQPKTRKNQKLLISLSSIKLQQMKINTKDQQNKVSLLYLNSLAIDLILKSESKFQIFTLSPNSNEQSLEIYKNDILTKLKINLINLNICQLTAESISNLGKSIYSCKNVIKSSSSNKLASLFSKQPDPQIIKQQTKQTKQIILNNFRLIIFDSFQIQKSLENEFLMPNMFKQEQIFLKQFKNSFDRIKTKSAFLIEFKITCILSNDHQFIKSLGNSDFSEQKLSNFDSFQIFKIQNFLVYQNQQETTLTDLVNNSLIKSGQSDQQINYLTIIHPIDSLITIFKQDEMDSYKKQTIDIVVNSFELEFSIKQFFKLKLLSVKIKDNLKPLLQIFEHYKQKDKLLESQLTSSLFFQINILNIFLTLVCEIDDQQLYLLAGVKQDYGMHLVTEYQPLFSIEGKNLKIKIQKQPDQKSNKVEISFPFEINYFNSAMNSFEPVIEKTTIQIQYQQSLSALDQQPEEQIEKFQFEFPHLANINLSITLFDTLFRAQSIFKLQKMFFSQYQDNYIKNIADKRNQSQPIEGQKNKQDQVKQEKKQEKRETIFSGYTIRNQTGELLLFRSRNQKIFQQLQPDEELPLDFTSLQTDLPISYKKENKIKKTDNHLITLLSDKPWECEVDSSSSYSSDHESENEEISNFEFQIKKKKPQSVFRKNNFHFLRKQPRILVFQILIQRGLTEFEKSKVFQISVEGQTWQRIILDQKREKYVVCQVQQADGRKYVVIRSPFQFVNHLHFPIEVTLGNRGGTEQSSLKEIALDYEMLIMPQSINIIPLRACDFTQVQMRPVIQETTFFSGQSEHAKVDHLNIEFEWTDKVNFTLLKNETELFEQKPLILDSKMLSKKGGNFQFPFYKIESIGKNNRIYMVLNANTFNRRGFVDFNTQQTEFIQIRYLSVSPPFVFKNLVPIPITLFFKNLQKPKKIIETNLNSQFKKDQKTSFTEEIDNKTYDLDLKHNSEVQILYLNPLGNFDLSLIIPGYQMPNFQKFKSDSDQDFKLCEDIKQSNFINALFSDDEIINEKQKNESKEDGEMEIKQLRNKTTFRFSQMKTIQFNLTSQFQNQFNLSLNISFIQGQYHISFYSQYWLINNTFMPLDLQLRNAAHTEQSEKMALPYKRNDFDFCQVEGKQDQDKLKRKNSGDTFITTSQNYKTNLQSEQNTTKILEQKKKEQIAVNNIDYKVLTQQQKENKGLFGRIKPWEAYKFQQQENEGLLGLLDQQDIDQVQVVYFTQEDYCEENKTSEKKDQIKSEQSTYTALQYQLARNEQVSQATSLNEQRYIQARMRIQQQFQQNAFEQQSVVSKNSIQILNYQSTIENMKSESLVHTPLSNSQLFTTPFEDISQLKRIVLYSENFTPIVKTGARECLIKSIVQGEIPKQLKEVIDKKSSHELCLKICDSEWTVLPLDPAKLQTQSIILKDKSRRYCTASMYELVASIQHLPHPFNLSIMIEFKSRFIMINQTSRTIQVIQADCEEQGLFKIYPLETTNFHWTDSNKPKEINVRFDDHEYSGNLKIDTIGEMSIRLRATYDTESVIIQVQVSEQNRQFQIVFTDISCAPPYRIENLTKTSFKISQEGSRPNDFDILHPYQIIGYAWSYSQLPKFLNISINTPSGDSHLGSFNLENISKQENFKLNAKSRQFSLQITQEKTIKTIRISYEETVEEQNKQIQSNSIKKLFNISISQMGFSIINQYELAYIFIKNLSADICNKNLSLQIGQIQIDNQLKRERSAIVFCRDYNSQIQNYNSLYSLQLEKMLQANYFINLQVLQVDNTSIPVYKYFYLVFNPFCLSVDGNFCDEMFRYVADIRVIRNRYKDFVENEFQNAQGNKFSLGDQTNFDQKIVEMNEKKQNNYGQGMSEELQKKVYFEEFFIGKIKMNFSFNSSPVTFNELGLNSTLKFFIVLMSNLKKVNLSFEELNFKQQQSSMTLFFKQIKRHYLRQCFNHHQILKILLSNGLFGNISQISSSLSNAIEYLVFKPFNDESFVQGVFIRGARFISQSVSALLTNPIFSFLETLKGGANFLYQNNQIQQNQEDMNQFYNSEDFSNIDKLSRSQKNNEIFLRQDENLKIERDFCILGTVQNEIDTQNQIWFKTILKEYYQNQTKRQFLLSKQKINFQTHFPFNFRDFQQNQLQLTQNSKTIENINDTDFQEFSLDEIHSLNQQETNKQLELFSRRQDNSQYANNRLLFNNISQTLFFGVKDIPQKLISQSQNIIQNVNQKLLDEKWDGLSTKTRPPRFTSFTMQVEPYNLKKAICLEILNKINFTSVVNKENIQKFYVFGNYAIIFTGKRLICVQEEDLIKKTQQVQNKVDKMFGFTNFENSYLTKYKQNIQPGFGGKHHQPYMHWNVLFEDIVKIKVCLVRCDQAGRVCVLDGKESQRICGQEIGDVGFRQGVMVSLKIIFTEQLGNQEGQGGYQMNDFRVDSRDILVQVKDSNALLKVVNQIYLRSLAKIN